MKKPIIIATSIVCGTIMLLGCTSPSTPAAVSKNLDSNLNSLQSAITQLDTIDNNYLTNPDIYPVTDIKLGVPPKQNLNNILSSTQTNKLAKQTTLANVFNPRLENKTNAKLNNPNGNVDTKNPLIKEIVKARRLKNMQISNSPESDLTENTSTQTLNNVSSNKENLDETKVDVTTTNENLNTYTYTLNPVKYSPRYSKSATTLTNQDYLQNYINKVQTLYAITNDAIEANSALLNYKTNILQNVSEIKELNSSVADGTFVPNGQQIAALNNYIEDIKTTIKRVKDCNGDLSDKVSSINTVDVGNIVTSIDVINSNYLSILNHIDTRIVHMKNALNTLEQIKAILLDLQNVELPDTEVPDAEQIQEALDQIEPINKESGTIENEPNTEMTETNMLDLTETEDINKIDLENKNAEIQEDTSLTAETETLETANEESSNLTQSPASNNNDTVSEDEPNKESGNIDTYKTDTIIKPNIDTFNNENLNNNTEIVTDNNADSAEEKETEATTISIPNVNTNTINNTAGNNGLTNQSLTNDEQKINAPNGRFQNGIITQNNLNGGVNNGVNGVNTGNGSGMYTNSNARNTNKNIDTYGQNTIIDLINQGTVNNGINTLSISQSSAKPTMVSEVEPNLTLTDCEDCGECENCTTSEITINDTEEELSLTDDLKNISIEQADFNSNSTHSTIDNYDALNDAEQTDLENVIKEPSLINQE